MSNNTNVLNWALFNLCFLGVEAHRKAKIFGTIGGEINLQSSEIMHIKEQAKIWITFNFSRISSLVVWILVKSNPSGAKLDWSTQWKHQDGRKPGGSGIKKWETCQSVRWMSHYTVEQGMKMELNSVHNNFAKSINHPIRCIQYHDFPVNYPLIHVSVFILELSFKWS